MTPAEIVCTWMEKMPNNFHWPISDGGWWKRVFSPLPEGYQWLPNKDSTDSLDALREVEARLNDQQLGHYDRELNAAMGKTKPKRRVWYAWNASAEEKLLALAEVLGPEVKR